MILHLVVSEAQINASVSDVAAAKVRIVINGGKETLLTSSHVGILNCVAFNQTIHYTIDSDASDSRTLQAEADISWNLIRVDFYMSIATAKGTSMPLGMASVMTSPLEHAMTKRLHITNSDDTKMASLLITLLYYKQPLDLTVPHALQTNTNSDRNLHIPNSREYQFLMSRRLNSLARGKPSESASFFESTEKLLDAEVAITSTHPSPYPKSSQAYNSKSRQSLSGTSRHCTAGTNSKSGTGRQSVPSATGATTHPTTRQTSMAVGYVGVAWPDAAKHEQEKTLYKIHLATQRRLESMKEVSNEVRAKNIQQRTRTEEIRRRKAIQDVENAKLQDVLEKREKEIAKLKQQLQLEKTYGKPSKVDLRAPTSHLSVEHHVNQKVTRRAAILTPDAHKPPIQAYVRLVGYDASGTGSRANTSPGNRPRPSSAPRGAQRSTAPLASKTSRYIISTIIARDTTYPVTASSCVISSAHVHSNEVKKRPKSAPIERRKQIASHSGFKRTYTKAKVQRIDSNDAARTRLANRRNQLRANGSRLAEASKGLVKKDSKALVSSMRSDVVDQTMDIGLSRIKEAHDTVYSALNQHIKSDIGHINRQMARWADDLNKFRDALSDDSNDESLGIANADWLQSARESVRKASAANVVLAARRRDVKVMDDSSTSSDSLDLSNTRLRLGVDPPQSQAISATSTDKVLASETSRNSLTHNAPATTLISVSVSDSEGSDQDPLYGAPTMHAKTTQAAIGNESDSDDEDNMYVPVYLHSNTPTAVETEPFVGTVEALNPSQHASQTHDTDSGNFLKLKASGNHAYNSDDDTEGHLDDDDESDSFDQLVEELVHKTASPLTAPSVNSINERLSPAQLPLQAQLSNGDGKNTILKVVGPHPSTKTELLSPNTKVTNSLSQFNTLLQRLEQPSTSTAAGTINPNSEGKNGLLKPTSRDFSEEHARLSESTGDSDNSSLLEEAFNRVTTLRKAMANFDWDTDDENDSGDAENYSGSSKKQQSSSGARASGQIFIPDSLRSSDSSSTNSRKYNVVSDKLAPAANTDIITGTSDQKDRLDDTIVSI